MPSAPSIARIRLARSLPRLLWLPALLFVLALATAAGGTLLLPQPAGLGLLALAAVLLFVALGIAARALSVRLDVEEAAVVVRWLGGSRTYTLTPGPVTRVRLRGEDASRLQLRTRPMSAGPQRALLRETEEIEVVRLAATPTAILVPTDRGRLAVAAADEAALLDALTLAAHARARSEEASRAAEAPVHEALPAQPIEQEPEHAPEPDRPLTGIERALLERRLAEEREAAEAAARAAAEEAERRAALEREARLVAEQPEPPSGATQPASAPARERRRRGLLPRPRWSAPALRVPRPGASLALVAVPLLGAGVVWGGAVLLDRLPEAGSDIGRLTALALVLAGPATTVGAIMARAWWPRLVGVVVTGGLVASVFIGRVLLLPN